jgi:predicted phage terminase large subunit-like protein
MTGTLLRSEKIDRIKLATTRLKEKIEAKAYEGNLIDFVDYMWPVVEPAIPFVKGWPLSAIADHLQAVTRGQIRRLLINVPPGFSKSTLVNVMWPAWEWGPQNRPWYRYVCAAYSNHLTERDNMKCRNVVMSERYQRLWGNRFRISNEQFTKVKFANDQTGWKLATSTGGIGVGERGDRFVIDDPNNTMLMESEAVRYTTNMWFTEVVPDRLNHPHDSVIVVIQQRLHEEDVSGTALDRELGYTHLCIPMEYVPHPFVNGYDAEGQIKTFDMSDEDDKQAITGVFWQDPRTEDGELAWPVRFGDREIVELKKAKGPYAWAGQYQQTPEIRGGSIIRRDYWTDWDDPKYPDFEYILASIDTAYTEKQENDASAMTLWGLFRDANNNPKIMLMHAWQERLEIHKLVERVIDYCTVDYRLKDAQGNLITHPRWPADRLLIEAKATGLSVAQEIRRIIGFNGEFGIELINPTKQGDKVARAHSVLHLFSDGMIYAPISRAWCQEVIDQCAKFPKGSHDDFVDSTTQALRFLRDNGMALMRREAEFDLERELAYKPRLEPLYPV